MIRFDPESRAITLSVRDLLAFDAAQAMRPEPLLPLRAQAGSREHRRHRKEAEEGGLRVDYRAERPLEFRIERRGYRVTVQGRIDGVYREGELWVVEEVKSVILDPSRFAPGELARAVLDEGAYADYRIQLELYVFFLSAALRVEEAAAGDAAPGVIGRLVLRNLRAEGLPDGWPATVEIRPDPSRVQAWLEGRLDLLIDRLERQEAARATRRADAGRIAFPFPRLRPHQGELLDEVAASLERGEHLLVSAPTGVGKTAAVLCAALRHALASGRKIIYVTARTTQQRLVAETLERIAEASAGSGAGSSVAAPFRAVVLRARDKICPNLVERGFVYCHEDFCPYARDYAVKVESSNALGRLLSNAVARPEAALEIGLQAAACPFELSLDAALEADVVVGDYNHVFDPESHLRRIFQDRRSHDAVLIIDEAHNLAARGRDSFSPAIARREVAALERGMREEEGAGGGARELRALCRRLEGLFAGLSAYGRDELGDPPVYPVELDPAALSDLSKELEAVRTRDLLSGRLERSGRGRAEAPGALDPLGDFAARWARFTGAVEALSGSPFLVLYDKSDPGGHRLRVLCLDPSAPLGRRLGAFHSVIAFSATLEPLAFYRDILGFPAAKTRTLSLPSPFPPENRKVLVWDRVSTYWKTRGRDAAEIARLVEEVAAVEPGNYLACFSSYAYLRQVLAHLSPEALKSCVVQTPGMSEAERDRVLAALREPGSSRLVFAVQGGIFTEGVDYPGRMLIGSIVIGPGLPAVCYDEERVRDHFEDRFQEGFEYAYLYPGMNRVIQSAGRVIRSETDVGVVVLLGERFAQSQYARLFPSEWYRASPKELVSRDLVADLREFWAGRRSRE